MYNRRRRKREVVLSIHRRYVRNTYVSTVINDGPENDFFKRLGKGSGNLRRKGITDKGISIYVNNRKLQVNL